MAGWFKTEKNLEIVFAAVFSALVFVLFFSILGANGLILGNDPAVHLQRAKFFLDMGEIPLSGITVYPPLYHIVLNTFIAFTGATTVGESLVLMKAVTALIDWMLVFSVYLVAAKFFSKKTGVVAAMLLMLCFPLYEINSWGSYPSILSLAFMVLVFLYLALPLKNFGYTLVAFVLAFSMVMSHPFATFLSVFVLPLFILVMLARSKGHHRKTLIAVLLGGGIAFFVYYLQPILPYLSEIVSIVFFQLKTMLYQVPFVTFDAYMTNFGFLFFFAFAGLVIAFFKLKKAKSLSFFLLLSLAFLVPLALSQAYLVGMYLEYARFVYYLMPFLAVLAAVSLVFVVDAVFAAYWNNKKNWQKLFLKVVSVVIVCALVAVMVVRFQTVTGRIEEATEFYSFSDVSAYQAGNWIKQNSPDIYAKVVVTESPGQWFGVYSGREVIAETDPVVQWNEKAECVLDLSYDLEHPLTMVRAYEAKGNIADESYVSTNMVWRLVAYSPEDNAFVSYRDQNDLMHSFALSSLNRTLTFDTVHFPKRLIIQYSAEAFAVTKTILVHNDTYPVTVTWQLTALKSDLSFASLYVSEYFDPKFSFDQAYVPETLDWANPWSKPSKVQPDQWAITDFYKENLATDNNVAFYDTTNEVCFGLRFADLPDFGNIGALGNENIDAVRFQYNFFKLDANYTITASYQMLSFAQNSYPQLQNYKDMNTLFDFQTEEAFEVKCRNFASIIRDTYIGFLVYSEERFNKDVLSSGWVELVYSNDKYVVLKIKADHPYVTVLE